MSGYLVGLIRSARGTAFGVRMRPRARFETFALELESEAAPPVPAPPPVVPPHEAATTPTAVAPPPAPRVAEPPRALEIAPEPVPRTIATESVRHVTHRELRERIERVDARSETSGTSGPVVHRVERVETIATARGAERAEPVAAPLSEPSPRPPVAPPVGESTTTRVAPAAPAPTPDGIERRSRRPAPIADRTPGIEIRREPPRDAAPEITVVIGRLDVQLVRDAAERSPAPHPPSRATPIAAADAPALAEYLRARPVGSR